MSIGSGFIRDVRAPLWLLDLAEEAYLIPLGKAWRGQTNPLYPTKPGATAESEDRRAIVKHCGERILVRKFSLDEYGRRYFLCAQVRDDTGPWINVWQGKNLKWGTLFCAVEFQESFRNTCICEQCDGRWFALGWVCPGVWKSLAGVRSHSRAAW